MVTENDILNALKAVKYPGYSRDIVSFGLVKQVAVSNGAIHVSMQLTGNNADAAQQIKTEATKILQAMPDIRMVHVDVRPAPGGTTGPGAPAGNVAAGPNKVPGIKRIVAIASGKGGVGKSTVATNLALALKANGHAVGLMDADIYGPSIPMMLRAGLVDQPRPPLDCFGIKMMSMGLALPPNEAAMMRGPMIHKYLAAFLTQLDWGELDYLLVDMPPGTGDAYLSLCQMVPLAGAVIVVTPQEVSQNVARRGVEMFRGLRVPLLGIIENMSYFTGDDGKRYAIFGQGGGQKLASDASVPFLGDLPIDPRVAQCGDAGEPIVHKHADTPIAKAYLELARTIDAELKKQAPPAPLPGLQL